MWIISEILADYSREGVNILDEILLISNSILETDAIAKKVGSLLHGGDIIAYIGLMGAGKTTFTRGLCLGLGLPDEVISPTFTLVNEYKNENISLYHFDMYRINSIEDLETTGFYDFISKENIIVIEWSENIINALPKGTIFIKILAISEETRQISIEGDERFEILRD